MVENWKQVAEPVGGRKGLKQARFAWHGGSLIKDHPFARGYGEEG